MSVLIRDMKMPENCCQCEWHEYYGGDYDWCHACRRTGAMPIKNAETERNYDCPLVEVKAPHGRLIDANDFEGRVRIAGGFSEHDLTEDFTEGVLATLAMLRTQFTVIEEDWTDDE